MRTTIYSGNPVPVVIKAGEVISILPATGSVGSVAIPGEAVAASLTAGTQVAYGAFTVDREVIVSLTAGSASVQVAIGGSIPAAAGPALVDKTGSPVSGGGSSAAPTNVVYVDTTGVTETSGDIGPALYAALVAADQGLGVAPKRVIMPPGLWRLASNVTVLDKSIDYDGSGAELVIDVGQDSNTTDFNVASTAGWPASGTLTVTNIAGGTETIAYTGVGTSPTRFTGCSGGSGAKIAHGALVTNGTQTTTANKRTGAPSGDVILLRNQMGNPVAVTATGGATQSGSVPELYVNSTAAFAASGTLTVTLREGTTTSITYTGKTPYSFTGCTGGSGVVLAGATVTDGTNTTQTLQTKYPYPFATTTVPVDTASNAATIPAANTDNWPSSGALRVVIGTAVEIISYTGKTLTSFTGCSGGSGTTITAGTTVYVDGLANALTRQSYGTRIYCDPTGISYGDVIKLFSDDILNRVAFNAAGTGTVEFQAEFGKVMAVHPWGLIIDRELYLTYETNVRLVRLERKRTCRVRSMKARWYTDRQLESLNQGGFVAHVNFDGYVDLDADQVGALYVPGPNVNFQNCYNPRFGTVYQAHALGDTSLNQVGYCLNGQASQGGGVKMIVTERVRHSFTTNANDVARAGNSSALNYGGLVDFHVETLLGYNNESFAWDTHTDGINVTGGRVIVRNDFQPRSEQMGAAQFRGYKLCGIDHIHYDGPGYALLLQGDVGAVDFRVGRITGAHQYTYRGGAGTTERNTTTASGAQTLPSATFNVASAANLPTAGSVLVHTSDSGPQTISYTGVTGAQLTGVTGGTGSVSSGAIVCRVVEPNAKLRIDSIDVVCTGGTNLIRHTRSGLLDIGELRVRYLPDRFKPQANLSHTILSFATALDPDNSRLRIGKMHIDLSAYPSAAAQPVSIYAFAMDTSSASQNYKFNQADIGSVEVDFGAGYGSGPGTKFALMTGTGQSKNGVSIGDLQITQTGAAAGSFNPAFWGSGTLNQTVRVLRGRIRGSAASVQELGDNTQSFSSATQALYHAGANYFLTGNTLGMANETIRGRYTVTNAAGKVTSLQAPAKDGQVWKLACAVGSANPLVIASGQISNVGTDLSVAAANEITLTAVGGAWVKYTAA